MASVGARQGESFLGRSCLRILLPCFFRKKGKKKAWESDAAGPSADMYPQEKKKGASMRKDGLSRFFNKGGGRKEKHSRSRAPI